MRLHVLGRDKESANAHINVVPVWALDDGATLVLVLSAGAPPAWVVVGGVATAAALEAF